jgi:phosphoserine phosphatase
LDGGFREWLGYFYFKHAALVYTTAESFVADTHLTRQGFSRECDGIERAVTLYNYSVEGYSSARLYGDDISDVDIFALCLAKLAVFVFNECGICADREQAFDRITAFADRDVLEELADLLKEHYEYRLGVFARGKCGYRCY